MGDFWVNSTHPEDLADGRVFGPGKRATDVDAKHPHNKALIDDGRLQPAPPIQADDLAGDALKKRAADLNIEGRSSMSADELRDAVDKADKEAK